MLKKMIWLMLLSGMILGPMTACETTDDVTVETGESMDAASDDLSETVEN